MLKEIHDKLSDLTEEELKKQKFGITPREYKLNLIEN